MFRGRLALVYAALVLVPLVLIAPDSSAHDSWIYGGGFRNAAGEWCCGEGDCALMAPDAVKLTTSGYAVHGIGTIAAGDWARYERYDELVPEAEAQPSPDGRYWRCKRPDGSRRCFFAPPPAT